jgi:NAD+ diphosphatase
MPFADLLFSYCPRCGQKAFSRKKPGLLTCSACGLVFYLNTAAAVAAILRDDEGRILLTRRAGEPGKGLLDFPGGFVDPGESAEDALRRELREEIGLEPETLLWFGSLPNEYEYEGITYQTLDLFFECMETDLSALKPLEEIQEILLLRPDEVGVEEIAFPSVRTMMRRLVERQDSPFPV